MPMSLKRFSRHGELFKATEMPSSWGDNGFCAPMSVFSCHPNTSQLWVAPVYDARACACVNLRGFLNTSCWHGLCSQAPSVTGATHTHTETRASALYLFCLIRPFCMCFKAVSFFFFLICCCVKIWTWQPQPTRSCITSRMFCSVQS